MPFDFPGVEYKDEYSAPSVPLVTFLSLLLAYPQAGIEFLLRNFNTIEPSVGPHERPEAERMSIHISAFLREDADKPNNSGRRFFVWTDRVNLNRFLPPEVMKSLKEHTLKDRPNVVLVRVFLEHAQTIADALNREVRVIHQSGGNMEYAGYEYFEPFLPGGDGKVVSLKYTPPNFW